jgi:peptidoglycan/xylan/chitin deacetylase (PgdA/CDA1 family)
VAQATDAVRAARSLLVRPLRPVAVGLTLRWIPGSSAAVLMYHRVADRPFDPWRLAVAPDRFADHMQVVRRHFHPVSLSELADGLDRGVVPSRAVAVTFDDGYKDNLYVAKPVLEQHEIPGTVFVTSGYVDSGRSFWWDELERITFAPRRPTDGPLEIGEVTSDWSLPPDELYLALWEQLHPLTDAQRLETMDRIAEAAGVPPESDPNTMTASELRRLADGGLVDVGGHTVTHPSLPGLPRASQLEEIRESRLQLEALLDRPVASFCFPHGKFSDESVSCVVEGGYAQSCISNPGVVRPGVSRFEMPRLRTINWYGDLFAWELAKFFRRDD